MLSINAPRIPLRQFNAAGPDVTQTIDGFLVFLNNYQRLMIKIVHYEKYMTSF